MPPSSPTGTPRAGSRTRGVVCVLVDCYFPDLCGQEDEGGLVTPIDIYLGLWLSAL